MQRISTHADRKVLGYDIYASHVVVCKLASLTMTTSAALSAVQCCFPSTEPIRLIRDGGPRTATSTLTQLLSSALSAWLLVALTAQQAASFVWPHRVNVICTRHKSECRHHHRSVVCGLPRSHAI